MKTEKLARVRYDAKEDEFVLEIWDNEFQSWGLCRAARCVDATNAPGVTDFIHFSFMKEVVRCAELGYSVHFMEG